MIITGLKSLFAVSHTNFYGTCKEKMIDESKEKEGLIEVKKENKEE